MMDNLYLDKLKGSITESDYDRFYQSLCEQRDTINNCLMGLQEADDNYFITTKYLLELTNRAYDLFVSSEVEQRRQLIKLVLQNLRVEGENVVYELVSPFDCVIKLADDQAWCAW